MKKDKSLSSSTSQFWDNFKNFPLWHLSVGIIFVMGGIITSIAQLVLFLTIGTFNVTLFRRVNYYLTYALHSQLVFLAEWWSNSDPLFFGDASVMQRYFGKEHALLVMNHSSEVDWIMGWVLGDRVGVLGNCKAYLKKVLQYLPGLGWSWKLQEHVLLARNWEMDRKTLPLQLAKLGSYPSPVWLGIFPEGTRFTQEKHKVSMEVAKKKGFPLLKHQLLPRTKGFVSSIPHLRENFKAIYDFIFVLDKDCVNQPTIINLVRGKQIKTVLMIRRIPMEEVPTDEEKAAEWLQKLFQDRDKFIENYLTTGNFVSSKDQGYNGYEFFRLDRRIYSLVAYIFWTFLILVPLGRWVLSVFVGSYMGFFGILGFGGTLYMVLRILFSRLTEVKQGSSYGSR